MGVCNGFPAPVYGCVLTPVPGSPAPIPGGGGLFTPIYGRHFSGFSLPYMGACSAVFAPVYGCVYFHSRIWVCSRIGAGGRAVVFLLPSREGIKNINWVESAPLLRGL